MATTAWLVVRDVRCSDDTEEGKDELYVLYAGNSGNAQYSGRVPRSDLGHWSIRDNGKLRIVNASVHGAAIPDGSALFCNFIVQEQDGQAPAETIKLAASIAQKIPHPASIAIGAIVEKIPLPKNKDDFIGTASVMVKPDRTVEWLAGDNTVLNHSSNDSVQVLYCTGSNTKYWIRIDVVFS